MNTYAAVMLGVALATSGALAQNVTATSERTYFSCVAKCSPTMLEKAKKAYYLSLTSDNDGVVESAIAQIAYLQAAAPREDMSKIEEAVSQLANNGRTAAIRYKAQLAGQVFTAPQMFTAEAAREYASSEEFFSALSSRLQKTFLGDNRRAE